jgi:SAM-dependent methyltransferase
MSLDDRDAMAARYAARTSVADRYSMLRPEVWQTVQERQRAMLRGFTRRGWNDLSTLSAVEVGCGAGGNLLELLRLGFVPERLTGVELLPDRLALARRTLPASLRLVESDAVQADVAAASADLVLAFTVFSSLLDDATQRRLADAMWPWVKPGGAVLCYDFTVDNPRNRDVRGVPVARLRELFPRGGLSASRVTLAPPLARVVCRAHPSLYTVFNWLPLRTHVLAWIDKPAPLAEPQDPE